MKKNTDFFFGSYYPDPGPQGPEFSLSGVLQAAEKVSSKFFTKQLNRLLGAKGGRVVFSEGNSSPRFLDLLQNLDLDVDPVGFIEIYARKDLNPAVNATLACDLVLEHGVISIVTQWCAYKSLRAYEIVETLLKPLHQTGLIERSFIRWEDGEIEPLCNALGKTKESWCAEQLALIFELSGYPVSQGGFNKEELNEWAEELAQPFAS